jgi:hypothetical protein
MQLLFRLRKQVRALVLPQQTAFDRKLQASTVFGRLTTVQKHKRPVDLLDVDTTVLDSLNAVGDLEEFMHRGFGGGIGSWLGKLHFGLMSRCLLRQNKKGHLAATPMTGFRN